MGLLARAYKDLAGQAAVEDERRAHLEKSYEAYRSAFDLTGGYWTAINAATLARVLGRVEEATDLAETVEKQCLDVLAGAGFSGQERYWVTATLAESALVRGDWGQARTWYERAAAWAGPNFGGP